MNWLQIVKILVVVGATILGMNGVKIFDGGHHGHKVDISSNTVSGIQK